MVSVQGNVEVRRAGQTTWQPARLNDTYCAADRIQVGERSRADVALVNQPVLRLDQDTTITFGGMRQERTSIIELVRGALYFFSRLPRNLEIITAFVNAGVEGTEGLVQVEADRTLVTIFEGKVLASNQAGNVTLTDGQSAIAEKGQAPVLRTVVRPRDAVQWALYYPPSLYLRPEEFQAGPGWQGLVRNSIEAYTKGDFQAAFEAIKGVPNDLREPRFFVYRASLLLAVGRVDEAGPDLERALSLDPNYGEALGAPIDHRRCAKRQGKSAGAGAKVRYRRPKVRVSADRSFLCSAGEFRSRRRANQLATGGTIKPGQCPGLGKVS